MLKGPRGSRLRSVSRKTSRVSGSAAVIVANCLTRAVSNPQEQTIRDSSLSLTDGTASKAGGQITGTREPLLGPPAATPAHAPNPPFIERTFGQCVDLEIANLRYTGSCLG
jgi:hypothetical protein